LGRVVVGIDGSAGSRQALVWAADYATATGVEVALVIAWHYPAMYGEVGLPAFDFEADSRKVVDQLVTEFRASYPEVVFSTEVVRTRAAEALIQASGDARLLVVGSRGHGAFASMLIGSVSIHCVQHAACPVVVVR